MAARPALGVWEAIGGPARGRGERVCRVLKAPAGGNSAEGP